MKESGIFTNAIAGALAGVIIAILVFPAHEQKDNTLNRNKKGDTKKGIEDHWISTTESINDITKE